MELSPPAVIHLDFTLERNTQSLSGVTHAFLSMWEYMEVIRQAAEPKCADHLQKSIETIDDVLGKPFSKTLKGLFGLHGLQHDEDFAALIAVYMFLAYLQFLMDTYATVVLF
jgi:hypothetical protein